MAFNVRLFGYRGIVQGIIQIPQQDSKDSLFMLKQPYEFALIAASNGSTPVVMTTGLLAQNDFSRILRVEIPDGSLIRYEVNTAQHSALAGNISPILSGIMQLEWTSGASFSFVDAASFP
jgi:hypothetical protein